MPSPDVHKTSVSITLAEWRVIKRAAEAVGASFQAFVVSAAAARARNILAALEREPSTPIASHVPILQGRLPEHLRGLSAPISQIAAIPPPAPAVVPHQVAAPHENGSENSSLAARGSTSSSRSPEEKYVLCGTCNGRVVPNLRGYNGFCSRCGALLGPARSLRYFADPTASPSPTAATTPGDPTP